MKKSLPYLFVLLVSALFFTSGACKKSPKVLKVVIDTTPPITGPTGDITVFSKIGTSLANPSVPATVNLFYSREERDNNGIPEYIAISSQANGGAAVFKNIPLPETGRTLYFNSYFNVGGVEKYGDTVAVCSGQKGGGKNNGVLIIYPQ